MQIKQFYISNISQLYITQYCISIYQEICKRKQIHRENILYPYKEYIEIEYHLYIRIIFQYSNPQYF